MKHHQPTTDTKILGVEYLPAPTFVLPIIAKIQASPMQALRARMEAWANSDLRRLGLDVSTKIAILRTGVPAMQKEISDFYERLVKDGVSTAWVKDLQELRKVFFHNRAPWIAVSIDYPASGDRELLLLTRSEADFTNADDCIPLSRLQAIYAGLNSALETCQTWAIDELKVLETKLGHSETSS